MAHLYEDKDVFEVWIDDKFAATLTTKEPRTVRVVSKNQLKAVLDPQAPNACNIEIGQEVLTTVG